MSAPPTARPVELRLPLELDPAEAEEPAGHGDTARAAIMPAAFASTALTSTAWSFIDASRMREWAGEKRASTTEVVDAVVLAVVSVVEGVVVSVVDEVVSVVVVLVSVVEVVVSVVEVVSVVVALVSVVEVPVSVVVLVSVVVVLVSVVDVLPVPDVVVEVGPVVDVLGEPDVLAEFDAAGAVQVATADERGAALAGDPAKSSVAMTGRGASVTASARGSLIWRS
ncbi:hypothetical protein BH09ACT6_BH09ACT6_03160 [soil metagenome]